jgi:HAD superfamily hydrolase (TIGR01450 family)
MRRTKGLLIDLDGVLVQGKEMKPLPGARDFITFLRDRHMPFRIVTNNSTGSPAGIARRLRKKGISVSDHTVISPLGICPQVFRDRSVEKVFVMGTRELKDALSAEGFHVRTDPGVDAVLVAQDRTLNFEEIKTAITALRENGAALFSMNDNKAILDDDGLLFAGAGAICRMLIYAADYHRRFVHFGKMGDLYNNTLFHQLSMEKEALAVISDDLYTDIKGFQEEGLMGIFLTTGKYRKTDITEETRPDLVFDRLSELMDFIRRGGFHP